MCLIMTIIASLVFTVIWGIKYKNGNVKKSLFTTMLMFWSASVMWSIDGIANVLEGEGFFDISMEDTVLGGIIVLSGCVVFLMLCVMERIRKLFSDKENIVRVIK